MTRFRSSPIARLAAASLGASVVAAALAIAALTSASREADAAEADWRAALLPSTDAPKGLLRETGDPAPAPDGLPDGRVATASASLDVRRAWYAAPTARYGHAVLGDGIEAGALVVETADGAQFRATLPEHEVFEDRSPRIADLDGDGRAEIVTILADQDAGAAVSVFGLSTDGVLAERARGPAVGRRFRWLNIAGIADFAGLGRAQIAKVTTPHIGGNLHLLDFDAAAGALTPIVPSLSDLSNHEIGSPELRLSAVADVDGDGRPDLALPSNDRRSLRLIAVGRDGFRPVARIDLPGRVSGPIAVEGADASLRFLIALVGGEIAEVARPR